MSDLLFVCLAEGNRNTEVEEAISCREANAGHGMSVTCGRMKINGEIRFRMAFPDGSAYVRTCTQPGMMGWQNPHYHKTVRETYAVQSGWIGYVEYRGGVVTRKVLGPGQVVTTEPNIAHNIYMAEESVIHTVKHGQVDESSHPDWHDDTSACSELSRVAKNEPKWEKHRTGDDAVNLRDSVEAYELYPPSYCHFDTLIWQAPAWSSAIFAIVAAVGGLYLDASAGGSESHKQLTMNVGGIILTFFSAFLLALGFALERFRIHQSRVKTWVADVARTSPQSVLQALVVCESVLLLIGAVVFFSWPLERLAPLISLVGVGWWIGTEYRIRRFSKIEIASTPASPQRMS